ncbi:hypothetical protein [Pseudomonas citronellolis]|uniref:hypothetical protein n=1 Tax=Pseudomonas citronellolis TaxID=53408 RepID=UPI0023E45CD5|nr:hypothetical protein [Pseudomonas citronellolis]MDF3936829.1 hypothetical protein [Pseudomonas citronellolis]
MPRLPALALILLALSGCAGQSSYNLGAIESPVKESFGLDDVERQPMMGAQFQEQGSFSPQQQRLMLGQ